MRVTVYGKADCQGCRLTGMKLRQKLIPFEYLDADLDPEVRARAASYGYLSAPVVVVDLGEGAEWSWGGYRPSEIEKLYKLLNGVDPEVIAA